MENNYWVELHKKYGKQDWVSKPSLFAETAITYFPGGGKVLDLGAGHGQDSIFFAENGFRVVATDIETSSLRENISILPPSLKKLIVLQKVDLRELLPFKGKDFEAVYAHLALHYFDIKTTQRIFDDIYRILKPDGVFAFFVNSLDDPEYGTGKKLEDDYFMTEGTRKRYFSVKTSEKLSSKFMPLVSDNRGESYKDSAKGVHDLVRFIGRRPT